jgi:gamma-glutamylcyclotransferase (GGCT)/AIG2-like uncharacterized protein YtfP
MTNKFFVYGTLKPGFGNGLMVQERYEGYIVSTEAATIKDTNLLQPLHIPFPYLITDVPEPHGHTTHGYVYTIENEATPWLLAELDALEGYDEKNPDYCFYTRSIREVVVDRKKIKAYVYHMTRDSELMQSYYLNNTWTLSPIAKLLSTGIFVPYSPITRFKKG